jgi:hypothetical protein
MVMLLLVWERNIRLDYTGPRVSTNNRCKYSYLYCNHRSDSTVS